MQKRLIPQFATEAEEADWWYEHRDEIAQDFVEVSQAGSLGQGFRARLDALRTKRCEAVELAAGPMGRE